MKLVAENVAGVRGGKSLFKAINFSLEAGSCLWLKGANGSGKTTLFKYLAGLSPPSEGKIFLLNHQDSITEHLDSVQDGAIYRNYIGYLGHQNAMKADLTLMENLSFWAQLYGLKQTVVKEALNQFQLETYANQRIHNLSTGYQRRAGLARLKLLSHLPLWLMDEPLSGLDHEAKTQLNAMVTDYLEQGGLNESGGMVIFSSHEAWYENVTYQINI